VDGQEWLKNEYIARWIVRESYKNIFLYCMKWLKNIDKNVAEYSNKILIV